MNKKSFWWLLVLLAVVVAKFALGKFIMFSWVSRFITLEQIQAHSIAFKAFVGAHYAPAVLLYIAIYAVTIAVGIPGVAPLSLLGGYLFGVLLSTVYGAFGATAGSVVAFSVVRYLLKDWVMRRYGRQFAGFNDQMRKYGANYLLMVHFASIIPFFFINTLAAISDVKWWTFIWTTVVGFIPLAVIYSFAGRELATIKSVQDILSPPIITVFVILILLAFLPIIIKHYKDGDEQ
jgi:uncharacterized membrane protein YdjX (TVP38/TMEM64 family)